MKANASAHLFRDKQAARRAAKVRVLPENVCARTISSALFHEELKPIWTHSLIGVDKYGVLDVELEAHILRVHKTNDLDLWVAMPS